MATRLMADPHAMLGMAGRFEVQAQSVEAEARKMQTAESNTSSTDSAVGCSRAYQAAPGGCRRLCKGIDARW